MLKEGQTDAFVTMGNTGGALAAALLHLGRIPGIKRPAVSTIYPCGSEHGFCFLLDIGANADCKPDYLYQFALMGSLYTERVLGIRNPRVAIVSNGEEEQEYAGARYITPAQERSFQLRRQCGGKDVPGWPGRRW
jgi:glycerol-3-phosphate acyltransferase PlsX